MTKRAYFGTDGIRGEANRHPMTAEVALRVGMAAGKVFMSQDERRHLVVIGKDTRLSGYMIEPALVAGFASVGMDVRLLGPIPTPGVAMMTRSMRADLGVMISASHNTYSDNGIKLFGPDGYKLSDEIELEIESRMDRALDDRLASPSQLGRARRVDDAQARYVEIVKATFPRGMRLSGLRVCVDCANGAAYKVAPAALYELGAEVFPIGVNPDGFNINQAHLLPCPCHNTRFTHGALKVNLSCRQKQQAPLFRKRLIHTLLSLSIRQHINRVTYLAVIHLTHFIQ